jgi:multidrug resistance efflux pump
LRAGTNAAPLSKDSENAKREVRPTAGSDERTELSPPGMAAGDGIVEPKERETKVAAAVPGRIASIMVSEGERVQAAAPLVQLEDGPELAALAAAEADLAVTQADFTKAIHGQRREDVEATISDAEAANARAALSKDVYARTQKLAPSGATTPDELEKARRQAEIDARTAESAEARRRAAVTGTRYEDVLAARARVASAGSKRDQAKANLERLTIRAPTAGTILQIKYRVGEYETPGAGQDPLLLIGDTSELRVRLDVDERDIGKLSLNAPAFVTVDAFPGRQFKGHVAQIGQRMGRKNVRTDDPAERIDTKILEVVIALEDRVGLLPGLRVSGYLTPIAP